MLLGCFGVLGVPLGIPTRKTLGVLGGPLGSLGGPWDSLGVPSPADVFRLREHTYLPWVHKLLPTDLGSRWLLTCLEVM